MADFHDGLMRALVELNGKCLALETSLFVLRHSLPPNQREHFETQLRLFLSPPLSASSEETDISKAFTETLERILRTLQKKEEAQ